MLLRILANKYLCLRRVYCLNNQDTREKNGERDKLYRVSQDLRANTSGFNSRAYAESKTSYTRGSNLQQFRSYEILQYSK